MKIGFLLLRFEKLDASFLVGILLVTVISVDLIINENHRTFIENISMYPVFQNLYSGLLITFIVTLIGNLIPFPTPYTFVLCFSSLPFINLNLGVPFLFALIASFGCLIGELGGYLVGRGTYEFLSNENVIKLERYKQFLIVHPKAAPILIFLAALTPISDDFITIPLGMLKYSIKKTTFWCWLGKLGLMLLFAYNMLNVCYLLGGESWILSIITLYLIIIMMYVLLKIDVIEILSRLLRKEKLG